MMSMISYHTNRQLMIPPQNINKYQPSNPRIQIGDAHALGQFKGDPHGIEVKHSPGVSETADAICMNPNLLKKLLEPAIFIIWPGVREALHTCSNPIKLCHWNWKDIYKHTYAICLHDAGWWENKYQELLEHTGYIAPQLPLGTTTSPDEYSHSTQKGPWKRSC